MDAHGGLDGLRPVAALMAAGQRAQAIGGAGVRLSRAAEVARRRGVRFGDVVARYCRLVAAADLERVECPTCGGQGVVCARVAGSPGPCPTCSDEHYAPGRGWVPRTA